MEDRRPYRGTTDDPAGDLSRTRSRVRGILDQYFTSRCTGEDQSEKSNHGPRRVRDAGAPQKPEVLLGK